MSVRADVGLKAGDSAPWDGVLVTGDRYLKLLLCENECR